MGKEGACQREFELGSVLRGLTLTEGADTHAGHKTKRQSDVDGV